MALDFPRATAAAAAMQSGADRKAYMAAARRLAALPLQDDPHN